MPAPAHIARKFSRTLPWVAFEGATSVVAGLLGTFVIGRTLGVGEVGQAGLAVTIVALVELASAAGIQDGVIRTRSVHTAATDSAHWTSIALSLAGMAVSCLAAVLLVGLFDDPIIVPLTVVASLSLLFNAAMAVPGAVLTRKMRAAALARRLAVGKLAGFLVLAAMALGGAGAWSIVVGYVATAAASAVTLFLGLNRMPRLRFRGGEVRDILGFGGILSLEMLFWAAATRVFGLIFGFFHGLDAYGAFQFALRLVDDLALLVQRTILRFGLSYFSALARSQSGVSEAFLAGSRLLTLLAAPLFAGIAITAPDMVAVLFGPHWLAAVPMIQLIAVAWIFGFPRSLVGPMLRANGNQLAMAQYAGASSVFMIAAAFATGTFSAVVATAAFCMRQVLALPWGLVVVRKVAGISIRDQLAAMQAPVVAVSVMSLGVIGLRAVMHGAGAAERLAACIGGGALLYACVLALVAPDLRLAVRRLWRRGGRRVVPESGP